MANVFFYDRVEIYIDGIPYLPNGYIRSFSIQAAYNSKLVQGFNPSGLASGKVIGNTSIPTINWTEFLVTQADWLNWQTFCIANPNAVLTVIPVSLATGVPSAAQFTVAGINPTSINVSAPSEGQEMTRDITFNAITCSNL